MLQNLRKSLTVQFRQLNATTRILLPKREILTMFSKLLTPIGLALCAVLRNGVITGGLAGIHFYNSSGSVERNAIFGAQLNQPGCPVLFPGNGYGVLVDSDGTSSGPFHVSISQNSIHDFTRNGILAAGSPVHAEIENNSISGVGPSTGGNQFGVFLALGAVGKVDGNAISQGNCGTLSSSDCFKFRSEGVVLRAAGDGTVVEGNIITNTQSGIFVNGANSARITHNVINNTDALSGIHVQFLTNSLIDGNKISGVGPINQDASNNMEGCGINEISGTSNSGNLLRNNTVNDAYCGVAYVTADQVQSGTYFNTLYTTFNSDQYPVAYPPANEP